MKNCKTDRLKVRIGTFVEEYFNNSKYCEATKAQYLNLKQAIKKHSPQSDDSVNTSSEESSCESLSIDSNTGKRTAGIIDFPIKMKGEELKFYLKEIGFADVPYNEVKDMKGFLELFICCDEVCLTRSQLVMKYLTKNPDSIDLILELMMNPYKERLSTKFKKMH